MTSSDQSNSLEVTVTSAMMGALGSLPITLISSGPYAGALPQFAPHAGTLKALESRKLAAVVGRQWVRTSLGEAVWENR